MAIIFFVITNAFSFKAGKPTELFEQYHWTCGTGNPSAVHNNTNAVSQITYGGSGRTVTIGASTAKNATINILCTCYYVRIIMITR